VKARLVPLFFQSGMDVEFHTQLDNLAKLLDGEAEILPPVVVGAPLPDADAALFPQLIGDAFKQLEQLRAIALPFLVMTSEFGTVAMWDWEIVSLLKAEGARVFTPYTLDQAKVVCRALAAFRALRGSKFVVFQDEPGKGMQASIFKRFYWWEEACSARMRERFGLQIEKRSFKQLAAAAKALPDKEADEILRARSVPTDATPQALRAAVKLYLALKAEIGKDASVRGAGINCLNESFHSDTTPCLAWSWLFEESGLLWACEADTMSLLTEYIVHESLGGSVMMSNVYPFLMGMAALKHEKIASFPDIPEPENHALVAHCGYFALLPACLSAKWKLRPKVLDIVDENATAIDARLPIGDVTMAKLDPKLEALQVTRANLEGYEGFPGSDCRNGAIVRVGDGRALMDRLYSHHQVFTAGEKSLELGLAAKAFGLRVESVLRAGERDTL
jgi:L-fucose isomerase-like protein